MHASLASQSHGWGRRTEEFGRNSEIVFPKFIFDFGWPRSSHALVMYFSISYQSRISNQFAHTTTSFHFFSLDWVHSPLEQSFDVEAYEEARGPQRPQSAMKMPCHVRHNLLMDEWEYSMYAVMTAQEETSKIREQRMKTSRKARKAILREESIGAMKKSLKKFFTSNIRSKKDKQESRDILFGKDRQLAMVLSFGSDNSSDESSSDEEI